jgi:hypothetical protein
MLELLEAGCTMDAEGCSRQPLSVLDRTLSSSSGGRPRILIDGVYLARMLRSRGPAGIARSLGCSARTVRRRIRELNLAQPGQPVFLPGTQIRRERTGLRPTRHANLSDEHLDFKIFSILQMFPNYGRTMVRGQLASQGLIVSRERIVESLRRVRGAPLAYGRRKIARKKYWVPAVNSLWHHDGQHGNFHHDRSEATANSTCSQGSSGGSSLLTRSSTESLAS